MEILIIGGIIVALMVYASTRIKKVSKVAYEREVFETAEFRIVKPNEFIIPVSEKSPYVFEARSRDFGTEDGSSDFYQCRALVTEKAGTAAPKIYEEQKTEKKITFDTFHKTISGAEKHFHLEIFVLPEFKEKYQSEIDEMLDGFAVK